MNKSQVVLFAAIAPSLSAWGNSPAYSVQFYRPQPGFEHLETGITHLNNQGQVVLTHFPDQRDISHYEIGPLDGQRTVVERNQGDWTYEIRKLHDNGHMTVGQFNYFTAESYAARYENGAFSRFSDIPFITTSGTSDGGFAGRVLRGQPQRPFPTVLKDGRLQEYTSILQWGGISDINENGFAVGYMIRPNDPTFYPAGWKNGEYVSFEPQNGVVFGGNFKVNNADMVQGWEWHWNESGTQKVDSPAVWKDGKVTRYRRIDQREAWWPTGGFNIHGDYAFEARDIDDRTGEWLNRESYVVLAGQTYALNDLLPPEYRDTFFYSTAMNDHRWIAGSARDPQTGRIRAFVMRPVPEPATVVGLALGTVALLRRRQRGSSA